MRHHPPSATSGDTFYNAGKAIFGLVPGGAEAFEELLMSPLDGRLEVWRARIGSAIRLLEDRLNVLPEDLAKNEEFISSVVQASRIAITTHDKEKLESLRNAVLNSALSPEDDSGVREVFLNIIDRMTPWHIRILKLYDDPQRWFSEHGIPDRSTANWQPTLMSVLLDAFPVLKEKRSLVAVVWDELHQNKLVKCESLDPGVSPAGRMARLTTDFGRSLLAFISEPDILKSDD